MASQGPWLRDTAAQRALTCFYHLGCPDGVSAAYAVYAALCASAACDASWAAADFGARGGPHFEAIRPGERRPRAVDGREAGRHVVYADVVPAVETVVAVLQVARSVTILDHHRASKPGLAVIEATHEASAPAAPAALEIVYDEGRSGGQIAWDWAHPGTPRPVVIDYIADRDLWRFTLLDSRAINKALHLEGHARSVQALARFEAEGGIRPEHVERGGYYGRVDAHTIGRLTERAGRAVVRAGGGPLPPRDYTVLLVNSPVLQSEVGEALMAAAPVDVHFAVAWSHDTKTGKIWASARTNRSDVDLSAIVPRLAGVVSGGGAPHAAAFTVAGDSISAIIAGARDAARGRAATHKRDRGRDRDRDRDRSRNRVRGRRRNRSRSRSRSHYR